MITETQNKELTQTQRKLLAITELCNRRGLNETRDEINRLIIKGYKIGIKEETILDYVSFQLSMLPPDRFFSLVPSKLTKIFYEEAN